MAALSGGRQVRPYGAESPTVDAVPIEAVRREFYKSYPADTQDAKRQAWNP
jgi:hypothetical protein